MTNKCSVYRLFADNLPQRADKIALIDGDTGRSLTYGGLADKIDEVADHLDRVGVAPGDRVVIHVRKGVGEVAAMLGTAKVGAVVVNVNVQWTPEQLAYVAADCQARALIVGHERLRHVSARPLPVSSEQVLVMAADGAVHSAGRDEAEGPNVAERNRAEAAVADGDLAMIIYTSGSTGLPKGVMLTHANICIGAETVIE